MVIEILECCLFYCRYTILVIIFHSNSTFGFGKKKTVIPELVRESPEELGPVGTKFGFVGGKKSFNAKIMNNLIKNL